MPRLVLISIDGLAGFYWSDPRARMPVLRALAERGVVAPRMRAVFPSTTWPCHVTLVTGVSPARHGVVANSILNRAAGRAEDLTGDPVYDAADLLRAPTLYDHAHAAGLRTAAIDWPATRHAANLDFNLPFFKDQAVFESHTAPAVWQELVAMGYPVDRQGEWAQLPRRFLKDAMVADLARHVVGRHAPDLLLLHFLCTDSLQHLHGPRSPEAYWAIEYVDGLVGRVLDALPLDTVVAVVSDHGFLPVTRESRPNVRLRRLGAPARFVMNHGAGFVYVEEPRSARDRVARDLAAALASLEGVAHVWTPAEYGPLGLPVPGQNAWVGDVLMEAAPGYVFVNDAEGDEVSDVPRYRGTHGHRPEHADNAALFLAAGPGVARGTELGEIASRDVAPTLARLLDLDMPEVEGRVLQEIFS